MMEKFACYLNQLPTKFSVGLCVAVLLGLLFFGLNPKDFDFANQVHWIAEQPGIHFGKYGIAYTQPFSGLIKPDGSEADRFSLELALKPAAQPQEGFNFIVALHNGEDTAQLLLPCCVLVIRLTS